MRRCHKTEPDSSSPYLRQAKMELVSQPEARTNAPVLQLKYIFTYDYKWEIIRAGDVVEMTETKRARMGRRPGGMRLTALFARDSG